MIKMINAKKSYNDFHLNCTLTIPKGSISGIVGSNGAGKSTAFKLLLGIKLLDSGSIEILAKA
ncbi:ATP-binding cassette domain-containing protein [Peptostreptococcaceae bacterium OttesenSCG-928-C18]|nr:ATP-binding cassette domain-containing protein [Peptostreptococcaceae bacterium OttesenSCG-928-C18]